MDISFYFLVLVYYEEKNKMKAFFDYIKNIYGAATKLEAIINNFKFLILLMKLYINQYAFGIGKPKHIFTN